MESIDKHKIVFEEKKVSAHVVLFVHGITSTKEECGFYTELSEKFNNRGFSTLQFDFRGHGESNFPSDRTTISGMIADLFVAIDYILGRYESYSIVAASFGASIFLLLIDNLKKNEKLKSVVFINPVTSYKNTFTAGKGEWSTAFFPKGGLPGLLRYQGEIQIGSKFIFNPLMGIEFFFYKPKEIKWPLNIPLLVLHGKRDSVVSIQDTRDFIKFQISGQTKLIEYEDAEHGLDEVKDEALFEILNFIRNCKK